MKNRYLQLLFIISILLVAAACSGPIILSTYGSMMGANGRLRQAPHTGIDFGEMHGAPVLAAADGEVVRVSDRPTGCGRGVLIAHRKFQRYTVYCHLEKALVRPGQKITRGEIIGLIGTTGNAVGVSHVHFEVLTASRMGSADGNFSQTEDPMRISVGCFDKRKDYPTDQFIITWPVRCEEKEEGR